MNCATRSNEIKAPEKWTDFKQDTKFVQSESEPLAPFPDEYEFTIAAQNARLLKNRIEVQLKAQETMPITMSLSVSNAHKIVRTFLLADELSRFTTGGAPGLDEDINIVIDNLKDARRLDFSVTGDVIEVSRVDRDRVETNELGFSQYLSELWKEDKVWLDGRRS